MIGAPYQPKDGDSILVLSGGGVVVANPAHEPFILSPDGTRTVIRPTFKPDPVKFDQIVYRSRPAGDWMK